MTKQELLSSDQVTNQATAFALEQRGFPGPITDHPFQVEMCQRSIANHQATKGLSPSGLAPVEELAIMAFCHLTGREIPESEWNWPEGVLASLDPLDKNKNRFHNGF